MYMTQCYMLVKYMIHVYYINDKEQCITQSHHSLKIVKSICVLNKQHLNRQQNYTNHLQITMIIVFDVVQNDTQITPYIRLYKFTKRVKKSVRKRQMFLYHKSE